MSGKKHNGGIQNYPNQFLDCRENHQWHWDTDWKLVRGRGGKLLEFTRTKVCASCGTKAHRKYDGQTGRVISGTYYEYVDGYQADNTDKNNRIDAGLARLEMLRRAGLLTTGRKSQKETQPNGD